MNAENAPVSQELDTRTDQSQRYLKFIAIFLAESFLIHQVVAAMPFIVAVATLVILMPLTLGAVVLMFELGARLFNPVPGLDQ